jgi:hypothetical protein
MARGAQEEEPPRQLRRIGGPPRKLPPAAKVVSKPAAKPKPSTSSNPKPKPTVRQPIKHDFAESPNGDDQKDVGLKRDSEGEDEDEWDEVAVADGSVNLSAQGTDYETDGTGKTNGNKSDLPTGDEEDVDLEAVYGYDFHEETEAQNGQETPSKQAAADVRADGAIEVNLGAVDGMTPEERRRKEVLALRK